MTLFGARAGLLLTTRPTRPRRYLVAVICVIAAMGARLVLSPIVGTGLPYLLFIPGIIVASWFGGLGAGLLATILSALVVPTLVPMRFGLDPDEVTREIAFVLFIGIGILISLLNEALRRAALQVEASTRAAVRAAQDNEDALALLKAMFAGAPIGVAVLDDGLRCLRTNDILAALSPLPAEAHAGRTLRELLPELAPVLEPVARRVLETGQPVLQFDVVDPLPADEHAPFYQANCYPVGAGACRSGVALTLLDVTERMRLQHELSRFAAIIESSGDAIVGKAIDGTIVSWNRAAERLYGYTADEARGQPLSLLVPSVELDDTLRVFERIRNGSAIETYDTVRIRKDGTRIEVSLTLSPIKDAAGRVVGVSAIARDVSERKRLERALALLLSREQAARNAAEAANRAKDDFLSTLSHELRTPLNAILGWSVMLGSAQLPPDARARGLAAIERNARVQRQLIEDLLDVSGIISGKVRLDVRPTDLAGVVEAAIDSLGPAADAKRIEVRAVVAPGRHVVSGDAGRLQQVIWNLLANSVKFTPPHGRVVVSLDRQDGCAELTVSDTGQGIAEDVLPFIFDRFHQADSTPTRAHGGLGIGLAIVRHLVELHGGTVSATSAGEGRGATFLVRVPISADRALGPDAAPATSGSQAPSGGGLAGYRLLVADDEEENRALLEEMLTRAGAEVYTAASVEEAVAMLDRFVPDVLISDIEMPGGGGFALIKHVRALEARGHRAIPAIALTARASAGDRQAVLDAGFQSHVSIPAEPADLIAAIGQAAAGLRAQSQG